MTKLILATVFLLSISTAALAGPFGGYMDHLGERVSKAAGGDRPDHPPHGGGHQG